MISNTRSWLGVSALLFIVSFSGGCAEKARVLSIGVTQFETEALTAIDAIDNMRALEIAPMGISEQEATNEFVDNVMELNAGTPIGPQNLNVILNPYEVTINPVNKENWRKFIGDLRLQYASFAAIFASIEESSFVSRNDVIQAEPYIAKLTAQMAYLAQAIQENPPLLLQHRSALLAELADIRTRRGSEVDKRRAISQWREDWTSLQTAENELMRGTAEQCLKAAAIGVKIRKQIQEYNQLSLSDISAGLTTAFSLASSITGNDFGKISAKASQVIAEIESDPAFKITAQAVLSEVNTAVAARR